NNAGTYDSVLSGLKNLVRASRANSPFITLRVHTTGLLHADHQAWAKFLDDLDECKVFIKLHFIAAHDSFRFGSEQTVSSKDMTLRLSDVLDEARNRGFVLAESALLNRDTLMHCGAISDRSWFVLPGSRLTRCNSAFNDPKNDCGSLDDHGFMHLYDRAKEWIDHSPFTYSECVNCDVLPICMGGCRIVDFKHPSDARCQIKRSVRAAILESTRSYKTEVRVDT
ncbi:MAG TPA: SPASM domain-containing protein, partial [Vineibacter sp.]|nr:SPASM domain-containing protein [Vineibacter sp.]